MQESGRTQAIQSPVIPDVAALIRANPGTISLGQGVVHYGPPVQVFEAVSRFGGQIRKLIHVARWASKYNTACVSGLRKRYCARIQPK